MPSAFFSTTSRRTRPAISSSPAWPAGTGQCEPRPGRATQDWRSPQRLDRGNPTRDGETKEVETEPRRRVAAVTRSTQAQRTLTASSKEEVEMPFKSGHTKQGGRKAGTPTS